MEKPSIDNLFANCDIEKYKNILSSYSNDINCWERLRARRYIDRHKELVLIINNWDKLNDSDKEFICGIRDITIMGDGDTVRVGKIYNELDKQHWDDTLNSLNKIVEIKVKKQNAYNILTLIMSLLD